MRPLKRDGLRLSRASCEMQRHEPLLLFIDASTWSGLMGFIPCGFKKKKNGKPQSSRARDLLRLQRASASESSAVSLSQLLSGIKWKFFWLLCSGTSLPVSLPLSLCPSPLVPSSFPPSLSLLSPLPLCVWWHGLHLASGAPGEDPRLRCFSALFTHSPQCQFRTFLHTSHVWGFRVPSAVTDRFRRYPGGRGGIPPGPCASCARRSLNTFASVSGLGVSGRSAFVRSAALSVAPLPFILSWSSWFRAPGLLSYCCLSTGFSLPCFSDGNPYVRSAAAPSARPGRACAPLFAVARRWSCPPGSRRLLSLSPSTAPPWRPYQAHRNTFLFFARS